MKNIFVIAIAVALSLSIFSCGNDGNSSQETASTPTETTATDDHAGHDHAGHDHDDSAVAQSSPMSPYIGIWKPYASTLQGIFKDNRWIEFYADSTFVNGANGKETNKGKWDIDAETNYMTIDYEDNSTIADEHWRAQLHLPVVVLIGNTDRTKSGEQIKMDKVAERPGYKK